MKQNIPINVQNIINTLVAAGHSAYVVGGAVRDAYLGRETNDFDITTSALPEEIKRLFSCYTVIETGIKHGTVTVLVENTSYEITTYRTETTYTDSRHPDKVTFVSSINEDLARRDFTVNAIAISHLHGVIDLYDGLEDIKSRIIRTVGDPELRFGEDALRILRALRFSSTLGFTIEKNTKRAIFALKDSLNKVSVERKYTEIKKLICGENAQAVIGEYLSVLKAIMPINGEPDSVCKLPDDHKMRLCCLLGSSWKTALDLLRADNETKYTCALLYGSAPLPESETELKLYISRLGLEDAKTVIAYRKALYGEDAQNLTDKVLSSNRPLFLKDLAVNGSDLRDAGLSGREISQALQRLLEAVIREEIPNEKEILLIKAKETAAC